MTDVLFIAAATLLGAAWRRWLGAADSGSRAGKVILAAGLFFALFAGAMAPDATPGRAALDVAWRAVLVALMTAGAILPHVAGFGEGGGWRDPTNIVKRWLPAAVPGALALLLIEKPFAAVGFLVACALAAAAWPLLEWLAGPTHRLTPPIAFGGREIVGGYTTYAELAAGALVAGAGMALWRL